MGAVNAEAQGKVDDARLDMARNLVGLLESGDEQSAMQMLGELAKAHESYMFQEVGKLTRELHDALGFCRDDQRIATITQEEIPNAQERLTYVITKTEESAHRTLDIVENLLPVSNNLESKSHVMRESWVRFKRREMDVNEFRNLSKELEVFLGDVCGDAARIKQDLSDVMVAQDYQDLTGQIIRQVINLVQEVEEKLVGVIRHAKPVTATPKKSERDIKAEGPQINKEDDPNVMSGQDEVDDLLSSLGF